MFMAPRDQCIRCWELDAVAAGNLDLAREALVPKLGATSEVCLAPLFDLEALQLREAVVEDVALAVVALVRARLGEELVAPLPLREALRPALGEDVRAAEREGEARRRRDQLGLDLGLLGLGGRGALREASRVAERRREDARHLDVRRRLAAPRHLGAHARRRRRGLLAEAPEGGRADGEGEDELHFYAGGDHDASPSTATNRV